MSIFIEDAKPSFVAGGFAQAIITTVSGLKVNVLDPDPNSIIIEDIAHALSNICRFCGQVENFYSVAEHCVRCSFLVPKEYRLAALLHDSSEAYLMDIPRPLKNHLPDYKIIEAGMERVICAKFGVPCSPIPQIKAADEEMLLREQTGLRCVNSSWETWSPAVARNRFLFLYNKLTGLSTEGFTDDRYWDWC